VPGTVETVRLEPFDPESHADLVARWLQTPHVAEWWGDPQQNLAEVLQRPADGDDALILADGVPVGYVRWQKPTRTELDAAGLHEIPDAAMDIDIAIGELSYVGRGVGSRALRQVVEMLAGDTGIPLIMLATSVGNSVAIRAYEKAGFRRLRTFDDPPNGEHWLMALEPMPGD
jgi:aminoglycoside 6'-N-acetyltransferase